MSEVAKQKKVITGLSATLFCLLLLRPLWASFVIAPAVTVLLFIAVMAGETEQSRVPVGQGRKGIHPAAPVLALVFAALFLIIWLRTKRLISLQFFQWREALPILLAAAVGAAGAIPFLSGILNAACRDAASVFEEGRTVLTGTPKQFHREDHRLLFLLALVSVSVCSLSSPLYPFNDWVDANCFFTMGKSMLFGIVPYRDLYEQKGPLLYALYALCYPISHRSFLGAWLLEIAAAWGFLSLAWKSHLLLTGKKDPVFLFLTAALVYTAPAFLKGGSAEELSLPLLMLSFYYGLSCLRMHRDLSTKEAFLIGLSSGAVLWIKYSMLGFYLGFIIVPAFRIIRKGQVLRLMKLLGMIILGVLAASLPVLAYFAYHHALSFLWEAYFYNNLFVYSKASSILNTVKGLASGLASMLTYNDATFVLVLFSLFTLWREKERAMAVHVFLCFGFAFGMIYAGGLNLKYYSEILCVFIPLGVTQFLKVCRMLRSAGTRDQRPVRFSGDTVKNIMSTSSEEIFPAQKLPDDSSGNPQEEKKPLYSGRLHRILIPILFTLALFGSENSPMLLHRRAEMPQYIFAETLKNEPGATLFNYGALDIGLFTTADIVPTTRYFCMLNLPSEEMVAEMERYMRDGVTDYIVSRGLEVESSCYRLLQTAEFTDNGTCYPYYLYIRSETKAEEPPSDPKAP